MKSNKISTTSLFYIIAGASPAYTNKKRGPAMSNSLCKERILSEDYRDFILDGIQTSFLSDIALQNSCIQNADFDYRCVYISAI